MQPRATVTARSRAMAGGAAEGGGGESSSWGQSWPPNTRTSAHSGDPSKVRGCFLWACACWVPAWVRASRGQADLGSFGGSRSVERTGLGCTGVSSVSSRSDVKPGTASQGSAAPLALNRLSSRRRSPTRRRGGAPS